MTPPDALVHELSLVERARDGDHAAFVELYRQDAPPAWRLALALTRDADAAGDAVTDAFRRALVPLRSGATTSDLPFRIRLLTATRHATLDARPLVAGVVADGAPAPVVEDPPGVLRPREVMDAFYALPERWRSILWLLSVEGVGSLDASRVLGVTPDEAEDLAVRAHDGLRQQWHNDHPKGGLVPAHLERQLQPILPLPLTLFDAAERRWAGARTRGGGPLGLMLPGDRPVPPWAERALVGATALLIALGITGAVVSDRDGGGSRARLARQADDLDGDGADGAGTPGGDTRRSIGDTFAFDAEPGTTPTTRGPLAVADVAAESATDAASNRGSTGAGGGSGAGGDDPSPTTTAPPLLQVTVGLGNTLGLGLGDCTGLELLGTPLGCPPDTADEGLTLEAESSLLPR